MRYYLFRLAAAICPHVPTRLGYWLFARIGDLMFLFSDRHSTYYENLRHVLGRDATPRQLNAVARAGCQNLLKNYFDLLRGHALTHEKIRAQLAGLHGFEHVENALKQGKGVIMGSAHFGAWDIVIHIASVYLNTRVVLPVERLKPERLFQHITKLRSANGIEIVPLENAPRALIKALRAGEITGLAYDRDITQTGPVVNFFGTPTQMPDGAAQLALKYDSPVLVGFSVRRPNNQCEVFIEPPIEFEKTGDRERDLRAGVQKIAAMMERYIREYPEQWLMFQKIWELDR